jgi:hypothetical protein
LLSLLIKLLVTVFVVLPIKLFVVLPAKLFALVAHLLGPAIRIVVWICLLPLKLILLPFKILF